jgi:hypothetical protein
MCYDEGTLMAHIDGEGSIVERRQLAAHLAECPACAASAQQLAADRESVERTMRALDPLADVVPLRPGDETVAARPAGQSGTLLPVRPGGGISRRWRLAAGLAAALLVVGSLGFAPVRHAAASILQIFRVQKVQTVSLSKYDLQNIEASLSGGSGHVSLSSFGDAWLSGGDSGSNEVSASVAQAAVDFPIKLPKGQSAKPTLLLEQARSYRFKLHVSAINSALQSWGSDHLLPASLEGKEFSLKVPTILVAGYSRPNGDTKFLVGQARSPELTVPDGVDAAQLRDVLVNLPFLPQRVRDQLASITDWQSTLFIPAVGGTAHDVKIDGVPAVVYNPKGAGSEMPSGYGPLGDSTAVIWSDGGVVRGVGGDISESAAIGLAKSTMRQ